MYHKTTLYYKLAIDKILENSDNMSKEDILVELNKMRDDKRDYSSKAYRR